MSSPPSGGRSRVARGRDALEGARRLAAWAPLSLALVLTAIRGGAAQERVFRTFGQADGLSAPPVGAIVQDSAGFIWIGAEGGLFRFDGSEIVRWAADDVPRLVMDLAVSPGGRVVFLDSRGRVVEVAGSGVRELSLPWGRVDISRRSGRVIAFDDASGFWMQFGDSVGRAGPGGPLVHGPGSFDGEVPRGLLPALDGVLVLTDGGLWRADESGPPRRVFTLDRAAAEVVAWASEPAPGRVLILVNVGSVERPRVVEVRGGEVRELAAASTLPTGRAIAVVERRGTVWVAMDRFLAAVRPGEKPEILGVDDGYESGGPLLVDREGSLWIGSYVGLHQYPEPDTRIWGERHGIPSRHTRFLARSGSTLWVGTWGGPVMLSRDAGGWNTSVPSWQTRAHICHTPDGRVWTSRTGAVVELQGVSERAWPGPDLGIDGCTPARDGGVWIGYSSLVYIHPQRNVRIEVEPPLPDDQRNPRPALLHDRNDRLWAGAGTAICHAAAARLLMGERGLWSCQDAASPNGVVGMVELDSGRLWAAAGPSGLLEYDGERWSRRHIDDAPAQTVHAVVPSPRGGVWIVGAGMLIRARDTADDRLEVLERLTQWHGLPAESAGHILEEESGDLWLATSRGLIRLPAAVRFSEPVVPPVALVEGRVDHEPIPLDRPLVLPHDRNRLELRFAALQFRHRVGMRHQVRLSPDDPWTESTGDPSFRWVDLPPGTYHVEYRASRDGVEWSTTAAGLTFRVEPPWYATGWFLALVGMVILGVAALIYRARVGYLLGLEQQRTRIAMDLHDQVGSGLASVGILSGLMATDGLGPGERQRTAAEIVGVAEELGHSLSDIVWTLDPQTSSLEELSARLAEHGERLFAGEDVGFEARLPGRWPSTTSSTAVRRSVLLIGLEALHNAARHAGAGRVTLALEPQARGQWALTVHDDGRGLQATDPSPRKGCPGRGLAGMARRAEAIGATLNVASGPARGTTVRLLFHPRGRPTADMRRRIAAKGAKLGRMIMRRRPTA
jgi:ligand-binding sensor domain-containing protein/anti-sigma regulatory factor (Ser/Thr protein kinase)